LDWAPQQRVPVLIGGAGPKTLALAGEISDGVILDSQYTSATVRDALGHVTAGQAGQPESSFSTVLFLGCSADQAATSAGPFFEAGVDTLVFQPQRSQTELADLITAAGVVAAKR